MLYKIDKKIVICVLIIGLVLVGGIIWYISNGNDGYIEFNDEVNSDFDGEKKGNVSEKSNNESLSVKEEKEDIKNEKIMIDISGEVNNPGVITLDEGARIIDAINMAGGATKKANLARVNLVYILCDAQKIYIPSVNDKDATSYISNDGGDGVVLNGGSENSKKEEKISVNINTATEEEFQKIPGIGSSIAKKIVKYRNDNGKFKTIEDLKQVSGIGESKFNSIKGSIYVK